jgi:3-phenylpropionate/trans-cinnamate dioxygenase ferredoxin component
MTELLPYRTELQAAGTSGAPWLAAVPVVELPAGAMLRVSFGDLDILVAHTSAGLVAVDDRCPHMAAPLSIGELDGCVVACPLHSGRFDLRSGEPDRMPNTGGLLPDGKYSPMWTPPGREERPDPPGKKSDARRLTRVRWFRYYPLRVSAEGMIEVAVPV